MVCFGPKQCSDSEKLWTNSSTEHSKKKFSRNSFQECLSSTNPTEPKVRVRLLATSTQPLQQSSSRATMRLTRGRAILRPCHSWSGTKACLLFLRVLWKGWQVPALNETPFLCTCSKVWPRFLKFNLRCPLGSSEVKKKAVPPGDRSAKGTPILRKSSGAQ